MAVSEITPYLLYSTLELILLVKLYTRPTSDGAK